SSPALRPPLDASAQRSPLDAPTQRDGQPLDVRIPREESSPAMRRPLDKTMVREGSDPALRPPVVDAGADVRPPEAVILRVPSARPPPGPRQVQRMDSPQSHDVKALIAQRLKLLDQGADHFQLLGVAFDVAPEALRKAYFALARQL